MDTKRRSSILVVSPFKGETGFRHDSSIPAAPPIVIRPSVLSGSSFRYVEIVGKLSSIDSRTTTAIVRKKENRVRTCHILSLPTFRRFWKTQNGVCFYHFAKPAQLLSFSSITRQTACAEPETSLRIAQ
jgi:hypothetical protein